MRALLLPLIVAIACGGPTTTAAPPSNVAAPEVLGTVPWLDREYELFATSIQFKAGRYADSERVLHVDAPVYLDVTGDRTREALVPLQIDEATTAAERGNPRFHSFIVLAGVDGKVAQLGELPLMTCGPLRADVEGGWLRITSARRGQPDDMCGGHVKTSRYRWNGTWFVTEDGDEVERRLP